MELIKFYCPTKTFYYFFFIILLLIALFPQFPQVSSMYGCITNINKNISCYSLNQGK